MEVGEDKYFFQMFVLPYPSNICLKCKLGLVPFLYVIHSFVAIII